jgi:hypothetical protein
MLFGAGWPNHSSAAPAPEFAEEKAGRTAAQEKMDSALVTAAKQARGEAIPPGAKGEVKPDEEGRVLVDLKAEVTPAILKRVGEVGGVVHSQFVGQRAIRASVPVTRLEELAADPGIQFVRRAVPAMPKGARGAPGSKP